jgi:hypothetical protein
MSGSDINRPLRNWGVAGWGLAAGRVGMAAATGIEGGGPRSRCSGCLDAAPICCLCACTCFCLLAPAGLAHPHADADCMGDNPCNGPEYIVVQQLLQHKARAYAAVCAPVARARVAALKAGLGRSVSACRFAAVLGSCQATTTALTCRAAQLRRAQSSGHAWQHCSTLQVHGTCGGGACCPCRPLRVWRTRPGLSRSGSGRHRG